MCIIDFDRIQHFFWWWAKISLGWCFHIQLGYNIRGLKYQHAWSMVRGFSSDNPRGAQGLWTIVVKEPRKSNPCMTNLLHVTLTRYFSPVIYQGTVNDPITLILARSSVHIIYYVSARVYMYIDTKSIYFSIRLTKEVT